MRDAGMQVESAKGECNPGQHEIAFLYDDALTTCDNHVLYKTGAKEIAAQQGCSLTFMAKYNEREGNSCHIHLSLRTADGTPVFAGDDGGVSRGLRALPRRPARRPARAQLLLRARTSTPTSGSSRAPSRRPPSRGATTTGRAPCASVGQGHGPALREPGAGRGREPLPGRRRDDRRRLCTGSTTNSNRCRRSPGTRTRPTSSTSRPRCTRRRNCWTAALWPARRSGTQVVDHYVNAARVETAAFDAAVTDWERVRGFERM